MQKKLLIRLWAFHLLALVLVCGCTSVKLESNKDTAAVRKVQRLFILINQGEVKSQPLSKSLSEALTNCFTNATPQIEIAVASPLDLDESIYKSRIESFKADAVLTISVQTYVVDEFGGYPTIMYDASLFDPTLKKRAWRAAIRNSGGTALMNRRMREMASTIAAKLKADGFIDVH